MNRQSEIKPDWRELVAKKQAQVEKDFPAEWRLPADLLQKYGQPGTRLIESQMIRQVPFMSETDLDITENYTATRLRDRLAAGEVTALAVTTAFCKRAAVAQQLTFCLTETFFPRALERARWLDEYFKKEGKPYGPLHGIPISLKDTFNVEGVDATIGFSSFLHNPPADKNSCLVDLLLDLGAVMYVKTNLPQTLLASDSENNIFGRTLNPHNTNWTVGGSSGGEAGLIAFRGSILGVGTDLGGSIRIPSLCCGTYGFKPTADRIPYGGKTEPWEDGGAPGISSVAGPITNSFEDVELFMSTVVGAQPWKYDVTAIGGPWIPSPSTRSEKLTIGIPPESPDFPLFPPVRRTLEEAIAVLSRKGHTIVRLPVDPSLDLGLCNRLALQWYSYRPSVNHIAASGEPTIKAVSNHSSPMFTGPFEVQGDLEPFEKIKGLHQGRTKYRDTWRRTWVENKLDVVLCPGAHCTAVPHDTYGWPAYTIPWNFVDYPACVIPYGKSSKELDRDVFKPVYDGHPTYEPEATDGAPCAISVVAPRFQDETCVFAARIIDRDLRDVEQ